MQYVTVIPSHAHQITPDFRLIEAQVKQTSNPQIHWQTTFDRQRELLQEAQQRNLQQLRGSQFYNDSIAAQASRQPLNLNIQHSDNEISDLTLSILDALVVQAQ